MHIPGLAVLYLYGSLILVTRVSSKKCWSILDEVVFFWSSSYHTYIVAIFEPPQQVAQRDTGKDGGPHYLQFAIKRIILARLVYDSIATKTTITNTPVRIIAMATMDPR